MQHCYYCADQKSFLLHPKGMQYVSLEVMSTGHWDSSKPLGWKGQAFSTLASKCCIWFSGLIGQRGPQTTGPSVLVCSARVTPAGALETVCSDKPGED